MAHPQGCARERTGREAVTSYAKGTRPGLRPRRKPHRKYDYSDCTRKEEGALVFLFLSPFIAIVLMGVGM